MKSIFEIVFLEKAIEFIDKLDSKSRNKVIYNIDKARYINPHKLFEKLEGDIWYFYTKLMTLQYRVFAFWDKTGVEQRLVVTTQGFAEKSNKVPKYEIKKLEIIRKDYFYYKNSNN